MNEPRHTDPQENRPTGRREQVAERTRHLRSLGVAGAVATLGVFTGLAAMSQSASSTTQPSQTTVNPASQSTQVDDGLDTSTQNGFFDSSSASGGVSAATPGSAASVSSGGS